MPLKKAKDNNNTYFTLLFKYLLINSLVNWDIT